MDISRSSSKPRSASERAPNPSRTGRSRPWVGSDSIAALRSYRRSPDRSPRDAVDCRHVTDDESESRCTASVTNDRPHKLGQVKLGHDKLGQIKGRPLNRRDQNVTTN